MVCKNFDELESMLQDKINSSLENEVYNVVKDVMQEHIQTDVYNVYSPTTYRRRYGNGGLVSDENIIEDVWEELGDNSSLLLVKNITTGNPTTVFDTEEYGTIEIESANSGKELTPIIEYGLEIGSPYSDYGYEFPFVRGKKIIPTPKRPFMHNTNDDLKANKQHINALKNGLKKHGIKVK